MAPYIDQDARLALNLRRGGPVNSGELAYVLQQAVNRYLKEREAEWGRKWQAFSDVLGALDIVKAETLRIKIEPHEESKRQENGDVDGFEHDPDWHDWQDVGGEG